MNQSEKQYLLFCLYNQEDSGAEEKRSLHKVMAMLNKAVVVEESNVKRPSYNDDLKEAGVTTEQWRRV